VGDVVAFGVPFVLGIVGTLLVEWRFKPQFERKRRAQERWENELQQLLELLEIRLPRLAEELNGLLGMASWYDEVRELEDLTTAQRDAFAQMVEDDRKTTQRAYEAWQEAAQTATVLTRRIARFHQQDKTTAYEISGWLYSNLYVVSCPSSGPARSHRATTSSGKKTCGSDCRSGPNPCCGRVVRARRRGGRAFDQRISLPTSQGVRRGREMSASRASAAGCPRRPATPT
jgi:hypothetical protein